MEQLAEQQRFHHLDAVRASALLLGILLHAIFSYLPGYREANWPLADRSTSTGLGIAYFVIHLFRMSLFFLIAGFFARLLHERLGTRGVIKNRLRRIALPLVAFYLAVVPLSVVAFIWASRQQGNAGMPRMEFPLPIIGPALPWGHLWFLYTLLFLYALVLMLRAIVVRIDAQGTLRNTVGSTLAALLRSGAAPLVLTIPVALSLYSARWWVEWQGIPSPIVGLVPNVPSVLAYGGAFLVGWFLHRRQDGLDSLRRHSVLYLAAAMIGIALALSMVGIRPRLTAIPLDGTTRALYACIVTFAHWCLVLGALGLGLRFVAAPSARWRYLADASYWMYLIHLPIIVLLQSWMLSWPLHWSIKLTIVLVAAMALLLASYHYLVRTTFMGVFLNGRRYPRGAPRGHVVQA